MSNPRIINGNGYLVLSRAVLDLFCKDLLRSNFPRYLADDFFTRGGSEVHCTLAKIDENVFKHRCYELVEFREYQIGGDI